MNDSARNIPAHIKKEVRERDKNRCRKCGVKHCLEFHHIIPFGEVGRHTKFCSIAHKSENIITLCDRCHSQAPDNPFELFKWICVYPILPPNFSDTLKFMNMGIPMLILKREKTEGIGYELSVESEDYKILIKDMELFLRDFWEVQVSVLDHSNDSEGWGKVMGLMSRYFPKNDKIPNPPKEWFNEEK